MKLTRLMELAGVDTSNVQLNENDQDTVARNVAERLAGQFEGAIEDADEMFDPEISDWIKNNIKEDMYAPEYKQFRQQVINHIAEQLRAK